MNKLAEPERAEEDHGCCMNCGSTVRLLTEPVVPLEYGGRDTEQNALVVCRNCDLLRFQTAAHSPLVDKKMLNLWLSHDLHGRVMQILEQGFGGLRTLSRLTRYLAGKYLENPENFDDLGSRQDTSRGVRVNFWMSGEMHAAFKRQAGADRLGMSEAVRGLFLLYLEKVETTEIKRGEP